MANTLLDGDDTLEDQGNSGGVDMEANFRGPSQTVATGYKSLSVEPDPRHCSRAVSSGRLQNKSAHFRAALSLNEKRRPVSQGSSDGMEDRIDKSIILRRTSAPDSPIRGSNKAHSFLPVVSTEGEMAESEDEAREENGKEYWNALSPLAHAMALILRRMEEQATEIERLQAELYMSKSEQSLVKTSSKVTDERPTVVRVGAALFQEIGLSRTSSGASTKTMDSPAHSPRGSPRSVSPASETGNRFRKSSKKKTDNKSPLQPNSDVS
jgi:hypothetical protein